jgi:uncharacterized repeat protein (TIGR03803 family)
MLNKKYTDIRTLLLAILATALLCPGAWGQTFKILHSFGNTGDGAPPQYGQVFDGQGNLYGVTDYGPVGDGCLGNGGCGSVYQLKPNADGTWTETLIHIFSDSGGTYPSSSLLLDSQGNLYGSASGQAHYPDVVYQLTPNSNGTWTESALYQFPPVPGLGSIPGELTFDAAENIFGTTRFGGANETGTVFSLDRSLGWQESLLFTFDGFPNNNSGGGAFGAITFDAAGNLYGTTLGGGTHDSGVVYKLTNQGDTWQQTVLYNFAGGTDGNAPWGVVFGPDGSLYGLTQVGGNLGSVFCFLGCGTVFKMTPNADGTWTKTTLYAFRGGPHDAAIPTTHITFDQAGNIYGTTAAGGSGASSLCYVVEGCGTVFKLTQSSGGHWTESVLHFFRGGSGDGYNPDSPLVLDGAGNLYGTTAEGGLYNSGVAYEITP